MAIEQADNVQTGAPKPTDSRYFNNLIPYSGCSEVNLIIGSGVRYSGLTVNINGTEYWYKDGITNDDLVEKTTGGQLNWTGNTSNALGTYVDGTHICAEPKLSFDGSTLSVTGGLTITEPVTKSIETNILYIAADGTVASGATPTGDVSDASNGITKVGNKVVLGGVLTGDTKIDTNGNGIVFGYACDDYGNGLISATNNSFAGGYACNYSDCHDCYAINKIIANGYGSFAFGYAHGCACDGSIYDGIICASGKGSFAGGYASVGSVIASSKGSFAFGYNVEAKGCNSHAEGSRTIACGCGSHAEGNNTHACGDVSHAEGQSTVACGISSHSEGCYTIAYADYQHASGFYNCGCTTTIAEIGVGTGSAARCNAFEVYCNGNIAMPLITGKTTETNILYIAADGTVASGATTQFLRSDENDSTSGVLTVNNQLRVYRTIGGDVISLRYPTGVTGYIRGVRASVNAWALGNFGTDSKLSLWNYGNTDFRIGTNGIERFTIDADGKVGIGNTNPTTQLDVNGTFQTSGVATVNNQLIVNRAAGNDLLSLRYPAGTPGYIRGVKNGVTNWMIGNAASATDDIYISNYQNAKIIFYTNGSEGFIIDGGGDVRIPTGGLTISTKGADNLLKLCSSVSDNPYFEGYKSDGTRIGYFKFCGTSNLLGVCNDGGGSIVIGATQTCMLAASDIQILAIANSCVSLRYNALERLKTVSNGICLPNSSSTGCGIGYDWVSTSDCRLKRDIVPISSALSTVNQLCGVCYHFCDDENNEDRIGLIAQDVQPILPEVVLHTESDEGDEKYGITDGKLTIKYDKITAVLIEAIKEQQLQINELQDEINIIKNI